MAIQYDAKMQNDVLIVTTSGFDESLEEVQQYGMDVIEVAMRHRATRVLCDERDLEYRLDTIMTFESAKFIAEKAPKVGRVAIVCAPECLPSGQFWETVAVNRGLKVTVTADFERALAWVSEEEPAAAEALA